MYLVLLGNLNWQSCDVVDRSDAYVIWFSYVYFISLLSYNFSKIQHWYYYVLALIDDATDGGPFEAVWLVDKRQKASGHMMPDIVAFFYPIVH